MKNTWIFGLPGNPVSTYISFMMTVVPLIERLLGSDELKRPILSGKFSGTFKKRGNRMDFVPCRVKDNIIEQIKYNGSGDFTSLARANAFFVIHPGVNVLKDGDSVNYLMI